MEAGIQDKIFRYESFINDNLKEDLRKVYFKRDSLNTEISEYIHLKNSIEALSDVNVLDDGFKTKMDMGCLFYVQAKVTDMSRILVDVGLGCYVEFTFEEALQFIEKRIKVLSSQTDKLKKDTAKINGTIKLMLGGLAELQKQLSVGQKVNTKLL